MGVAKKKKKAKLKEKRLKRIKSGKRVPFSLANVSKRLPGIQNTHQYKTNVHNLNFNESHFNNVKYSASNITNCNFKKAKLTGVDFIYTNLKRCNFSNAFLEDVIFFGANLKYAKFKNTHFKNVYFINTNIELTQDLVSDNNGLIIYNHYPNQEIHDSLKNVLYKVGDNDRIYKHRVLHVNKNKLNMWMVQLLLWEFSTTELVRSYRKIIINEKRNSNQNFFTYHSHRKFLNAYLKK